MTTTHWTRWALLAIPVAMSVALIATGITGWLSARQAAREVVKARAHELMVALHRELRATDGPPEAGLEDAVAELADQGLRFVALVDPTGELIGSGGQPSEPLEDLVRATRAADPGDPLVLPDGRVRVVGTRRPPRHGRKHRAPRWARERPPRVVLEFEPELARAVAAHATGTLATGVAAALVLLLAAVFFWRLAARADRAAAEQERDRHLATLGEMSAVLGHEIRNPLASLKGHAQLLLEKLPADHAGHAKAARVVDEALRLERLTNEVLEFARSGALHRAPCDPAELLRDAAAEVDGARVVVRAASDLPAWSLDRGRLAQVLANLLRNAIQASPGATPVEATVAIEDGALVFTVRDHGAGLPPGEEDRVLEPFYTRRVRGTGLGLAVARRIVEGHGGRLEPTNHPSGGALFRVTIPAAPA